MSINYQKTLLELVDIVEQEFSERGCSVEYVNDIKTVYRYLRNYAIENNCEYFDSDVCRAFLKNKYGLGEMTKNTRAEIKRAIHMLFDYQHFGCIRLQTKKVFDFPSQFSDAFERFISEYHGQRDVNKNTISALRKQVLDYSIYLEANGIKSVSSISLSDVNGYIKTVLCNYSTTTLSSKLSLLRRISKFLYTEGYHEQDFSERIIKLNPNKTGNKIPRAFKKEDVEKLLACVDRGSPAGKRDYAILLLAARLGMRAIDIENLQFDNIDWNTKTIIFTQHKTKVSLELPLLENVGWAIIDYLKDGRPKANVPEIFVRQVPPHIPLTALGHIVYKYIKAAQIPIHKGISRGTHSLRHSFATTLLEDCVPITIIRDLLGHQDEATTEIYTGVDISGLRQCALEVPYAEN